MQLQQAPGVNVCTFSSRVPTIANCLLKVVEQELAGIPRQLGSLVNQQLWSILYMPQVCALCLHSLLFCRDYLLRLCRQETQITV